jgi:hypothetical protein
MLVSVTRLDPAAPEGPLVRSATDLAVFARGELALFGTPEEIVRGARVFRITVRSNAEALRVALEERGCTLSGGPMRFAVTLPQPIEPTEILRAAAAARAGVVEMVPLM